MIDPTTWRTSTYSAHEQGTCVEVGLGKGTIGVQDTKNRDHGHLEISRPTFAAFIKHVKTR